MTAMDKLLLRKIGTGGRGADRGAEAKIKSLEEKIAKLESKGGWSVPKTAAILLALGLGGSLVNAGVHAAYSAYKRRKAYNDLVEAYPKFKSEKYKPTFNALAKLAPEVAEHPIMAAPILERAHTYGDAMGVPGAILDIHSKIKPRSKEDTAKWVSAMQRSYI
jgi:hypothetical protein